MEDDRLREGADRLWEEGVSDLEITKLCARAMGWKVKLNPLTYIWYNPLHDDAQAMAVVKKLNIQIGRVIVAHNPRILDWEVWINFDRTNSAHSPNLNRAIVECVAKMQAATAPPQ
jgi:hypothetical protein